MYSFIFLCGNSFEKALPANVQSCTPDFLRVVLLGQKPSKSLIYGARTTSPYSNI